MESINRVQAHPDVPDALRRRNCYALLFSAFSTALLLAFTILYGTVWEINDDPAIAWLLSRSGNSYSPFIGKLCSLLVHALYMARPSVNWWLISNYFAIFAGFAAILYVVYRRYPVPLCIALTVVLYALLWRAGLSLINFTRSAAIAAIGGCVLIADAVFPLSGQKTGAGKYILGALLLLLGQQIRSSSVLIALAMLASFSLAELILGRFSFRRDVFRTWLPKILLLFGAVALFFAGVFANRLLLTDEERSYISYNSLRSDIEDYSDRYKNYTLTDENLPWPDLIMFLSWFSEDTEVFNEDVLQATIDGGSDIESSDVLRQYFALFTGHLLYFALIFLCGVLFLLSGLRRDSPLRRFLAAISPVFVSAVLLLYLLRQGRLVNRVIDPVFFSIILCYLLLLGWHWTPHRVTVDPLRPSRRVIAFSALGTALLVAVSSVLPAPSQIRRGRRPWDCKSDQPASKFLYDHIDADEENLYFILPMNVTCSLLERNGTWGTLPADYCDNLFYLGGWDARVPFNVARLAKYGIENPARALIDLPNVYTPHNSALLDHMRRHYDARITESFVKRVVGMSFVRYTAPIEDSAITGTLSEASARLAFTYDEDDPSGWYVRGAIENPEAITGPVYCNLTVGGVRYTYRLCPDETGAFRSYFYGVPQEFIPAEGGITVFTTLADGSYAAIPFELK